MSIQLCSTVTIEGQKLVFGVNSWHKIVLAVCTYYSQNNTEKKVCISSSLFFFPPEVKGKNRRQIEISRRLYFGEVRSAGIKPAHHICGRQKETGRSKQSSKKYCKGWQTAGVMAKSVCDTSIHTKTTKR